MAESDRSVTVAAYNAVVTANYAPAIVERSRDLRVLYGLFGIEFPPEPEGADLEQLALWYLDVIDRTEPWGRR